MPGTPGAADGAGVRQPRRARLVAGAALFPSYGVRAMQCCASPRRLGAVLSKQCPASQLEGGPA